MLVQLAVIRDRKAEGVRTQGCLDAVFADGALAGGPENLPAGGRGSEDPVRLPPNGGAIPADNEGALVDDRHLLARRPRRGHNRGERHYKVWAEEVVEGHAGLYTTNGECC